MDSISFSPPTTTGAPRAVRPLQGGRAGRGRHDHGEPGRADRHGARGSTPASRRRSSTPRRARARTSWRTRWPRASRSNHVVDVLLDEVRDLDAGRRGLGGQDDGDDRERRAPRLRGGERNVPLGAQRLLRRRPRGAGRAAGGPQARAGGPDRGRQGAPHGRGASRSWPGPRRSPGGRPWTATSCWPPSPPPERATGQIRSSSPSNSGATSSRAASAAISSSVGGPAPAPAASVSTAPGSRRRSLVLFRNT